MSGRFNNCSIGICISTPSMMIVGYDHNILGHFTAITKEPIYISVTTPVSTLA